MAIPNLAYMIKGNLEFHIDLILKDLEQNPIASQENDR